MAVVLHTTLVGGHIFVTTHMHIIVLPKLPIKVAVLAKSVSQSPALVSSTPLKSLAVTFPLAMPYALPLLDNGRSFRSLNGEGLRYG